MQAVSGQGVAWCSGDTRNPPTVVLPSVLVVPALRAVTATVAWATSSYAVAMLALLPSLETAKG